MPRRYLATYEYSETIRGERRDFVHESMFEAPDLLAATSAAQSHFDDLTRESGVGWKRVLNRVEVKLAPQGAVAQGGRRVERERSVGE